MRAFRRFRAVRKVRADVRFGKEVTMYNFQAPLFWFKFVFLAEILVAEILIVYRMKKKKRFRPTISGV